MKVFFTALFAFFFNADILAQKDPTVKVSPYASNLFLEFGGNGALLSLNYDMRFQKRNNGIGGRAGIGIVPGLNFGSGSTPAIIMLPLAINYLIGGKANLLELGAGLTFSSGDVGLLGESEINAGTVFIPSVGYRYQSLTKGFTGRVVISPLIESGNARMYAGFSVGIRF